MGLFKTAVIGGAGIYAYKQYKKRQNQSAPTHQASGALPADNRSAYSEPLQFQHPTTSRKVHFPSHGEKGNPWEGQAQQYLQYDQSQQYYDPYMQWQTPAPRKQGFVEPEEVR